ncbi:MAG: NAD-dependent epimerase/dehydratase family protein [Gammaproteobacteria bacterium]|nr:NAD-dependent epimerase/dehydratase family protein [Gammaproteobacteria bacterium]
MTWKASTLVMFSNPQPSVETNIIGGLNVFEAVRHYKVPAVYIAVGNHWMNNSYSITKTTAERFAFMFNKEHGTKIAVVRGLNAYGPRQKHYPVRKIMPNFILPAIKGGAITVYGNGSQIMDMIYVSDLAEILVRALLNDHGVYDRIFEAGTGRETSVKFIAEEVIRQVGMGSIHFVPMRPGETENSVVLADVQTLEALGDVKMKTLEEGIALTIPYYKSI